MITIISSIIIFLLVILIHEFGHFIVAKRNGVNVLEFSVGMGPKIYERKKEETLYTLRLFPIGGYCQLEGEDEENSSPRALNNQTPWVRLKIILAGAMMNLLLAFVLLILLMSTVKSNTLVNSVVENSPAYSAGIKSGDKIVEINGSKVEDSSQIINKVEESDKVNLKVLRDGQELSFDLVSENTGSGKKIGVSFANDYDIKSFNLINGIKYGSKTFVNTIIMLYKFIGQLITGNLDMSGVSGPVGVVKEIGNASKMGLASLTFMLAYINLNLAVFNLLPIPALDGGRAVFILIEQITGKRVSPEVEGYIHFAGLIFLLGLIIFVTYKDIIKLI
ncbi:MAG: RIP metalloprotease RseP [Finegoldia sp.]|nr:RIP metalloprotease RseP [Finegoldia sp.]